MGVFYNDSKLGVSGHGGIAFKTGATSLASATTRLTITSSGLSEFEGDVKISKSTPVLTFNNLDRKLRIKDEYEYDIVLGHEDDGYTKLSHRVSPSA